MIDTTTKVGRWKEAMIEAHPHLDEDVINAALELAGEDFLDHASTLLDEGYQGHWFSDRDFAYDTCNEIYDLEPDKGGGWHPANYIDWDAVARDLMMDYMEHNGHYFRCL